MQHKPLLIQSLELIEKQAAIDVAAFFMLKDMLLFLFIETHQAKNGKCVIIV